MVNKWGQTEREDITSIIVDDEEIKVIPEMVALGSFRCVTCDTPVDWAVHVDGFLLFDCKHGHRSEIKV